MGLFEQDDPAIGLAPPAGTAPGTVFFNDQVTVHTPQDPVTLALIPGEVVSSPNNLQLLGLPGPLAVDTAPPVTTSFWSLTQENDRAAATLHLLFNDPDQAALQLPANTANTFAELSAGISPASFSPQGQRALLKLAALARPLITQVTRIPLPGAGTDRLTVVGSGFSDASAITLGGAAPLSSLVNSDAVIVLEVATGTAGPLVVTTPIGGASDPWMVVP